MRFTPFFKIFEGEKDWKTQANPTGSFATKILIVASWGLYIRVHKKNFYHQEWSVDEHDQLQQGEGRGCWWKWRHTYKPFHERDCRNMRAKIKYKIMWIENIKKDSNIPSIRWWFWKCWLQKWFHEKRREKRRKMVWRQWQDKGEGARIDIAGEYWCTKVKLFLFLWKIHESWGWVVTS